jgi:hypothetical protein
MMQFAPDRYPADYQFTTNATMGIMAKEVENAQLINMLGFVPPDSPAHPILVQAIFENSASANKKELNDAIKAMTAPPSEEQQQKQAQMEELQMRLAVANAMKEEALAQKEAAMAEKARAETLLAVEKAKHTAIQADLEDDLVEIQAANAVTAAQKTRVQAGQVQAQRERNQIDANRPKGG